MTNLELMLERTRSAVVDLGPEYVEIRDAAPFVAGTDLSVGMLLLCLSQGNTIHDLTTRFDDATKVLTVQLAKRKKIEHILDTMALALDERMAKNHELGHLQSRHAR